MKYKEVVPGIVIFDDILEDPASFITDIENLVEIKSIPDWSYAPVVGDNQERKFIDRKYRDVFAIGLQKFDLFPEEKKQGPEYLVHEFLNNNLLPYFEEYCSINNAVHWKKKDGWQLLKYGPEQFLNNHIDDHLRTPRTISMSYYPNDNYEGGEIEFEKFNLKIKPKANQAIFFPANYVYTHTIHTITSGFRYVVVNWWDL